jgi:putative PEP-CTERM system TPR-repeat lipoprotein
MNSLVQAEDYLSRAVKQDPASVQARRILAVTQLRLGQPAKALAALEPLLDDVGNDANLNALAGEIYMQNGDPRRAETYFARAATLDPQDVAKKTSVALTHLASGRADQGLGELERIASADTGTTADMALISTAMRRKDYAKALKAIDALEKKQVDNPLAPTLRGTVLAARGDLAGARRSYERALALKAAYFPAAASLAAMDMREKKPDDARKRFQGVLAADPKNVQALLALAEIAARSGAPGDEVAAQLGKAVQAVPTDPAPRLVLVNHHLSAKDAKKAIAAAQDALGAIPDEPRLLDALARAQLAAGEANQALTTMRKVESLLPNSPQLQVRIAEMQFGAKDKEGAEKSLRKALTIRADYLPAQRGLITLAMEAGKADEAKSILRDIRKQRPKEGVADLIEGDMAVARKAWPEAVAAYKAGLAATPTTELAAKLYSALTAAGKGSDAERFAERWIAEHEADAGFRLHLADAANRQKDYARAARHYQMVVQHQPGNVFVLNNLAWSLGQMRDPRALEYAERAVKLAPDSPAVLDTLGMIIADKGDLPRAIDVLRKAVELGPQVPLVRLTLARTYLKAGNKPDARKQLEELAKLGETFPAQAEVARLLKDAGG